MDSAVVVASVKGNGHECILIIVKDAATKRCLLTIFIIMPYEPESPHWGRTRSRMSAHATSCKDTNSCHIPPAKFLNYSFLYELGLSLYPVGR